MRQAMDIYNMHIMSIINPHLYNHALGIEAFFGNYFGPGTGPVLFGDLNCNGTESTLAECNTEFARFLFRRGHLNDAGVRCQHVITTTTSV